MEVQGCHREVNLYLQQLPPDQTRDLSVICSDALPVKLCKTLEMREINLEKLALRHVNITPEEQLIRVDSTKNTRAVRGRKTSAGFMQQQRSRNGSTEVGDDELALEKEKHELDLYKKIFKSLSTLTHLDILDCSGVLTDPVNYIKSLNITTPLLQSLKLGKTVKKHATTDDLLVLTSEALVTLAELDHLTVLHLHGFAGRLNRYSRYYFTKLDNAIEILAGKGQLEEFVFTQSGMTYHGVFHIIRHCKNLHTLTVSSRFGKPGLFMLHNNIPFLKLSEHNMDKATYVPQDEDGPRKLTLTLHNILQEEARYDPDWVNDTFPEERIGDVDLEEYQEEGG